MPEYNNYISNQQYDLALLEVDKLLKDDLYNISLLEAKADLSIKLNLYLEAIDSYNSLINLISGTAEYYAGRGLAYHFLKQKQEAIDNFSKAIELEPKNGYRYSSRAFIKNHHGDPVGALEDYNMAIRLDPEDIISLNNKGMVEEKLGRIELSQESFHKADHLAGIDIQTVLPPEKEEEEAQTPKMSFKHLISTINDLLSSKKERQKFIKYILKR